MSSSLGTREEPGGVHPGTPWEESGTCQMKKGVGAFYSEGTERALGEAWSTVFRRQGEAWKEWLTGLRPGLSTLSSCLGALRGLAAHVGTVPGLPLLSFNGPTYIYSQETGSMHTRPQRPWGIWVPERRPALGSVCGHWTRGPSGCGGGRLMISTQFAYRWGSDRRERGRSQTCRPGRHRCPSPPVWAGWGEARAGFSWYTHCCKDQTHR